MAMRNSDVSDRISLSIRRAMENVIWEWVDETFRDKLNLKIATEMGEHNVPITLVNAIDQDTPVGLYERVWFEFCSAVADSAMQNIAKITNENAMREFVDTLILEAAGKRGIGETQNVSPETEKETQ